MSSCEVGCAHDDQILCHILKISDLLFLVDGNAGISLVKPLPHKHRNLQARMALVTVNSAPIATFGSHTTYTSFDKVTMFCWIFVITDVLKNIIGVDFLRHCGLSFDFASIKLVYAGCNSHWELQTKVSLILVLLKLSCPATDI